MKKKILAITIIAMGALAIMSSSYSANTEQEEYSETELDNVEGKALFEKVCTKCHMTSPPSTMEERQAMLAPPIMGVMFHVNDGVKAKNPDKKRKKVIDFIVDYAINPSADKSFCEKHAIERFGVMPSQENNISKDELVLVANYLYDTYPAGDVSHDEIQKKMGMGHESDSTKKDCKGGKKKCEDKKSCDKKH